MGAARLPVLGGVPAVTATRRARRTLMNRRHSSALAALLWATWTCVSHAGPSLQHAAERDRALTEHAPWSGLSPLLPAPGLTLAAGGARSDVPPFIAEELAGQGGVRLQSAAASRGALRWQAGLAWRLGREPRLSLEGSAVAYDLGGAAGQGEVYASVQRRHWGPGWAGSLILDGAAPAVPAFGWRRPVVQASHSPWLSWLGPWGADIFVGRLQGHLEPARPTMIGLRVQLSPSERLDIGLSRTMQWGGRGRDESLSSLSDALLGNDNVGFGGITAENEPGNQLAGVDLRWLVDPASQTSFYAQVVGEDEAGRMPSRNMVLIGVDARVPTKSGSLRFFAEFADLLGGRISDDPRPLAAYRHSIYRQGYTQEGFSLGHALGGDARIATAGWLYRQGGLLAMFMASAGRAEPTAQFLAPGRLVGANASLQLQLDAQTQLGAGAALWSDRAGRRHTLQVWWRSDAW
jgi:Capsule assembly protein Wzi